MITAEQFEKEYAKRSKMTVDQLRRKGRIVSRCDCEEDGCEGWKSTTLERLKDEQELKEYVV